MSLMTFLVRSCYEGRMLTDGSYDVFIVDATVDGEVASLDLTVLTGEHKGEVVTVTAVGLGRAGLDLLGMPAARTGENGLPSVTIDEQEGACLLRSTRRWSGSRRDRPAPC